MLDSPSLWLSVWPPTVRGLQGQEWDSETCNGDIWVDAVENFECSDSPQMLCRSISELWLSPLVCSLARIFYKEHPEATCPWKYPVRWAWLILFLPSFKGGNQYLESEKSKEKTSPWDSDSYSSAFLMRQSQATWLPIQLLLLLGQQLKYISQATSPPLRLEPCDWVLDNGL